MSAGFQQTCKIQEFVFKKRNKYTHAHTRASAGCGLFIPKLWSSLTRAADALRCSLVLGQQQQREDR